MKKLISLLTALMMLCALLPVMAEGADLTGVWYLSAVKMGETEMSPTMMGLDLNFDLKADGTAVATTTNSEGTEAQDFTWALEDGTLKITQDGESMTFTVGEGRLEGDIGGVTGVFTREAPVAVANPEPVAAESEDAFLGTWKLTKVNMDGTLMPVDVVAAAGIEITATLTVEAGKASVVLSMLGTELPAIEGTTAFADGALAMTVEGLDTPISISLCDNGEIYAVISVAMVDTELPMYFAKAE